MTISKRMKTAIKILKEHKELVVSNGYKTAPATLVPREDQELTTEEIRAKYTENSWALRAVNRQTINKLVNEGLAKYTDKSNTTVVLIEIEKTELPYYTPETLPVQISMDEILPVEDELPDVDDEEKIRRLKSWVHCIRVTKESNYDLGYNQAQVDVKKILESKVEKDEC